MSHVTRDVTSTRHSTSYDTSLHVASLTNPNLMDPAEHLRLMRTKHVTLDNMNTKVNQATGKTTKSQWATNQRVMNTKKKKYRRKMGEQIIEGGGGWSERKGTPRTGDGGGESTEEENESDSSSEESGAEEDMVTTKSRASSRKRKATVYGV